MNSMKLTAECFILVTAMIWPIVHSNECDELGFQTIRHINMLDRGEVESLSMSVLQCKHMCLEMDGCNGFDWDSEAGMCYKHFNKAYEVDDSITHYHRCEYGLLPFSEDPLTAGFPAIDRNHVYHLTEEAMSGLLGGLELPIIIMQPPLTSAAGFGKARLRQTEVYLKWTNRVEYTNFITYAGIARPKGDPLTDGFDLLTWTMFASQYIDEFPFDGKLEGSPQATQGSAIVKSQPGDAIFLSTGYQPDDTNGVPYDIGNPDVCGVTYMGTMDVTQWKIKEGSLKALDECWMMSVSINLTPEP